MNSLLTISIIEKAKALAAEIAALPEDDAIEVINLVRTEINAVSPMKEEPIDLVLWVKGDKVVSNAYNPNIVAPPERKLLAHSIEKNGMAMPVVTWPDGEHYETVDGFHRGREAKENKALKKRMRGYVPITFLRPERYDLSDRMAATIEFNRARGKHTVEGMSQIVVDLKRRGWSDARVAKELGMDADEVLRLAQVSGLADMFKDRAFSAAWEVVSE